MSEVTTIMSVYNAERFLAKAMESILTQTFSDFEFVVINDGSTDRSLNILEKYAREDNRIQIFDQENNGLVKSLNKGLALAKGKFIARMDADDIAMSERFEKQVEYLENNPKCVAVGCEVLQIDGDGYPICKMGIPLSHKKIEELLLQGNGGAIRHPAVMMRKDTLITIGGYREQFKTTEDLDLFLRLARCGQLANLPDILLKYRLHLESINFTKHQQQVEETISILEEAYKNRELHIPVKLPSWRFKQYQPWERHRTWANMALKAGNILTARKHAFIALYQKPISRQSWQLVFDTVKSYLKI